MRTRSSRKKRWISRFRGLGRGLNSGIRRFWGDQFASMVSGRIQEMLTARLCFIRKKLTIKTYSPTLELGKKPAHFLLTEALDVVRLEVTKRASSWMQTCENGLSSAFVNFSQLRSEVVEGPHCAWVILLSIPREDRSHLPVRHLRRQL